MIVFFFVITQQRGANDPYRAWSVLEKHGEGLVFKEILGRKLTSVDVRHREDSSYDDLQRIMFFELLPVDVCIL